MKFLKYRHILKVACYFNVLNTIFWCSRSTLLRKASYVLLNVGAFQIHYTKQNFYGYHHCILLIPNKTFTPAFHHQMDNIFYVLGTFYFICMLIIAFSHTSFLFTFVGLTNEVRWQARFSGRFDYDYIFL